MKLLLCKFCQDVVKPSLREIRFCECKQCSIKADGIQNVNYTGEYAIIIGFNNSSLRNAVINQPEKGQGKEFISFVLPKECLSAIKKD